MSHVSYIDNRTFFSYLIPIELYFWATFWIFIFFCMYTVHFKSTLDLTIFHFTRSSSWYYRRNTRPCKGSAWSLRRCDDCGGRGDRLYELFVHDEWTSLPAAANATPSTPFGLTFRDGRRPHISCSIAVTTVHAWYFCSVHAFRARIHSMISARGLGVVEEGKDTKGGDKVLKNEKSSRA